MAPWWPSWISERNNFCLFFIFYNSLLILSTKLLVNWPFHSGEEVQNRFSRWPSCSYPGFLIGTILAIFYLQVVLILPTKFRVKKFKADLLFSYLVLQDGGHLGFLIRMILAIFELQVTPLLPIKFQVNSSFCSEGQNKIFKNGSHLDTRLKPF